MKILSLILFYIALGLTYGVYRDIKIINAVHSDGVDSVLKVYKDFMKLRHLILLLVFKPIIRTKESIEMAVLEIWNIN